MLQTSRRAFILGASSGIFFPDYSRSETPSLKAAAASRGIVYGCQIGSPNIPEEAAWEWDDVAFFKNVIREADILVSGGIMKWGYVEWATQGRHDFTDGDLLVAYAERNGLKVRGHALVWHQTLPQWFPRKTTSAKLTKMIETHINSTAGHWKGRLTSWDVVNEVIEPGDGLKDGLRNTIFSRTIGPEFIDLSFEWAKASDPTATLVLNETNLEYAGRAAAARRKAVLKLLEKMKKRGTPCDALGIQGHLIAGGPKFNVKEFRKFLAEVAGMGYSILVTELDVDDRKIRKSDRAWSTKVADEAGRFLDATLDEKAVNSVVTWGLSTKYSWLNYWEPVSRKDGELTRGLPLDSAFGRTPLYDQMISSFLNAPSR
jgi:endo-1,4-beta-xylanase